MRFDYCARVEQKRRVERRGEIEVGGGEEEEDRHWEEAGLTRRKPSMMKRGKWDQAGSGSCVGNEEGRLRRG